MRIISQLSEWLKGLLGKVTVVIKSNPGRAFISYAHEDEQAVSRIVDDLRREDIKVWFAPRAIQPGDLTCPR